MNYKRIALKQIENKVKSSTKNHLLDELLALRNIVNKKEIEEFLNPKIEDLISPYLFSDMEKAKKRIFEAIEKKENILIWGDFDCDGVTSSTILYKALEKLGANVSVFIPNRMTMGHGLNSKELIKQVSKNKIKLVITVDCGVSNVSEVNLLKSFKVDTIITDHHSMDEQKPDAFCIINPKVKGAIKEEATVSQITSSSYNSGSAVAYKLACALLEDVKDKDCKDELLIISAVGIIADIVPVLGENRAMVTIALNLLNTKKEKSSKPIYTLLKQNSISKEITSMDIAFILAPRINAVGRLADASLSFEFLTTKNDTKLQMIIEELNNYNTIRQSLCDKTFDEIVNYLNSNKNELENPAIILFNPDWHIGIIGIAASKVVEKYNKPCFLMTKDENNFARCSIRSNETINVYEVLKENNELLDGYGGHKLAGGLSFDLAVKNFETVKNSLLKTIKELREEVSKEDFFYADIEIAKNDINFDLIETINTLEPFGEGNSAPIFCMKDVQLIDYKTMGKENNHLKINFKKDDTIYDCVKWNEKELKIEKGSICDIAFFPKINEFNGNTTIQFEIYDIFSTSYTEEEKELSSFKLFDHRRKQGILSAINDYLKTLRGNFGIWAKTSKTKEILSKYPNIKDNFIIDDSEKRGIMFFDYPSNSEELYEIINNIKPNKIHFMNTFIDENIENYIKQLIGMVKYCANRLDGNLEIDKLSKALGVNNVFTTTSLEILENLGSIEIKDDKIYYLKSFEYESFKNDTLFEILSEEFEDILKYKKNLLNCDINELTQIVEEAYF